ncbi:MAG: trypsin-like peptidase domain-containing protein [Verrucomicrobia bacterium]|nr:trypsin-like peptidase domain-containing protein [Verrucomicrobiota bacterium]
MKKWFFFFLLFLHLEALEYPMLNLTLIPQEQPKALSTDSLDAMTEKALASLCIVTFFDAATWSEAFWGWWYSSFAGATGFFISPQGHLLTNKHVVQSNPYLKLWLSFSDGNPNRAHIVAEHPTEDIVILKMENAEQVKFDYLKMSFDSVEVGDWVFSLRGKGCLVNTKRMLCFPSLGKIVGNIQGTLTTSMHTTPGNSGSPLLNLEGNAVGIMTVRIRLDSDLKTDLGGTSAVSLQKVKDWIVEVLRNDGYSLD